ncbi:tear acid lipase-like protein precursor [Mesocricetus auratus]|uniref:Tear acid lipase-like protein n=2 Tax=Mesocricetus auratus TaxID=10036 RepID=TALLP_MESAU|nr:tear acid lipase-like protein precursor [Mesocricetus auratus]Q3YBN2.1 RecName: Full=Tear acid lipase-like protein; Short=TALLP; Flags: Precursor [Mesocricetus auratus]AAZ73232.1 tear acid-lipase-like protein [Mesocricetus auratus]
MSWLLSTMCLVHVCGNIFCLFETTTNPEAYMKVSKIVNHWGYTSEEYEAVTEDGYILPLNRIPHGKNNINSTAPKKVVLCQHGLFSTAGVWVSNPPSNSLAFILADAGFDVWMGNSRGSTWAKKHLYLDPNSKEFWAFSFDEMIKYDLPATINFILKKTGQKQIYYIGHSQGALIALGAFSTNQKLAEKIKLCFLLAPIATLKHVEGIVSLLPYFYPTAFKVVFSEKEFLSAVAFSKLHGYSCNAKVINDGCVAIFLSMTGYVPQHLNKSRVDVYIRHSLAGTSVQTLLHYRQAIKKGVFEAYDWGSQSLNMLHYNQTTPPLYNVEDMKIPTAMWSGGKDSLADTKDVAHLVPKISNLIYHKITADFSHLDFTVGKNAYYVSNDILKLLDKSETENLH